MGSAPRDNRRAIGERSAPRAFARAAPPHPTLPGPSPRRAPTNPLAATVSLHTPSPQWWVPASNGGLGWPGCNASGTRADEFGAEASRGVWRVALDALWSGGPEDPERLAAHQYTARVGAHLARAVDPSSGAGFGDLQTGCHVGAIHPDWYWNSFMYGPLSAALLPPLPSHDPKVRPRASTCLLRVPFAWARPTVVATSAGACQPRRGA